MKNTTRVSTRSALGFCLVVSAAALVGPAAVGAPSVARAEEEVLHVSGTLSSHVVACDSLCTGGTLTGSLAGTFEFRMDTMTPFGSSSVVMYTGQMIYHAADGDVVGPDVGIWNLATGRFTDNTRITSGTGQFAGATGFVTISGIFSPTTGIGTSQYQGVVAIED